MDNRDRAEEACRVNVKKLLRRIALVLLGLMVVASVLNRPHRSDGTGAQLLEGANVPAQVRATIERSCRDCHSEATRYPWYSYVPPVLWWIKSDVEGGKKHLNFSRWSEYSVIRRERVLSDIANQVQDGGMPLSIYVLMHRDAKLSKADVDAIFRWTQEERARLVIENMAGQGQK